MREDLVVPGEGEENFVLARDARVVTVPFTPLEVSVCSFAKAEGAHR